MPDALAPSSGIPAALHRARPSASSTAELSLRQIIKFAIVTQHKECFKLLVYTSSYQIRSVLLKGSDRHWINLELPDASSLRGTKHPAALSER